MSERSFDVVVVGAGPAGEVAAGRLGEAGLEVAIVEAHLVGGECNFYACMPSKALLRPVELLGEARRVPGITADGLDAEAVLRRRDEVIHDFDDSSQVEWVEARGVTIVRGSGRFDGPRRVAVGDDGDVLVARRAVIVATGSGPLLPPISGLAETRLWTNRDATTAKEVPASLVIVGGGVVGVELGQAWAALGARVTIVESGSRIIVREEPFASEQVADALRGLGVELHEGRKAVSISRDGPLGPATVGMDDGASVSGDELLVAVGRRPATEGLGLETIGLEPGQPVAVGDNLRSPAHDWLYAIGDANGRTLLTHMGKYHGRLAADAILGRESAVRFDGFLSPRVIFTDPQVAAVGHTLASAQEAGIRARALDVETGWTAGGAFVGPDTVGTSRVVVDEDRGVLVGATFTGFETAEMIHGATIAIAGEVPLEVLRHAVPSFPSRSELWNLLLEQVGL